MKRTALVLVTIGSLGMLFWACAVAWGLEPEVHGLPARLSSLLDLGPVLRRTDLTSVEKTEVLILWLREERAHPSPTTKGIGGGDISSGYIQAQIVKSLREVGDPLLLRSIASDGKADTGIRDGACVALGLMGDSTQVGRLISVLRDSREPDLRATAAEALAVLGATQAIPVLKQALSDSFEGTSDKGKVYPVRRAAEVTLRVLQLPEVQLRDYVQGNAKRFAERLARAEKERVPSR